MKIRYENNTYSAIKQLNKYTISMKKIYKELEQAQRFDNIIWEQNIKKDLEIIHSIRKLQEEHGIKVLNYYYQSCSKVSFIETLDGRKYIYKNYEKELILDLSWSIN